MSAFSWLARIRLLPPRDAEFYGLLNEMGGNLVRAAGILRELVSDGLGDRMQRLASAMKQLETDCDGVVSRTITQLEISPQPPFDRDDIAYLVKSLDDIMDWIERFSNRFVIYHASVPPSGLEQLRELAAIVEDSCEQVREAVDCLARRRRHVDDYVLAIHKLETQADEVHHSALAKGNAELELLFGRLEEGLAKLRPHASIGAGAGPGARGLFDPSLSETVPAIENLASLVRGVFSSNKLLELLSSLEHASDASDRVATTLKRMVMKNV
jgi:uncharacterized protein Yka (UPF0111/DUF47 family)